MVVERAIAKNKVFRAKSKVEAGNIRLHLVSCATSRGGVLPYCSYFIKIE